MQQQQLIVRAAIRAATAGPQPDERPTDYPLGLLEPPDVEASHEWRDVSFPTTNIDLVPDVDRVENQGSVNDCTGETVSTIAEVGLRRAGVTTEELSAFFPYLMSILATADALHVPPADTGTSMLQVLNLARHTGLASEAVCPSGTFSPERPTDAMLNDAATRLVARFERLGKQTMTSTRSLRNDIIVCMRYRIPFGVCLPIADSFFTISGPLDTHPAQWERTYMGAPNEVGRHAMAVLGLGIWGGQECLLAQNSYGPGYADGGFVAIPLSAVVGSGFDVLAIRELAGVKFGDDIPLSAYRWTRDTVLADGRRVLVSVDGNGAEVYRLYQAAFNRTPDAGGMGYWVDVATDGLASMHDIATSFVTSQEFSDLYGELANQQFVEQLYRNVLHREGDAGGIAFWTGHLNAGTLDRAGVLMGFAESPENRSATDPVISLGVVYAPAVPF